MPYRHLFFDLDHTLWDFDRNSAESICELYETFRLAEQGVGPVEEFNDHFIRINRQLWIDFDNNRITHSEIRRRRFQLVMEAMTVPNHSVCDALNEEYLRLLSGKTHLIESALEVLDYLKPRYSLHIITNGFHEIQSQKLSSASLTSYFQHLITSQLANSKKPDSQIFKFALNKAGAALNESLMIGDNYEADILGALQAGMDAIYYNPYRITIENQGLTHEVHHLKELMTIL